MSTKRSLFWALAISLSFSAISFAATIHVPTDQPTIQAGIDVSNPGDTILVAPGVYNGSILYPTHRLVITSSGGFNSTIWQDAQIQINNSDSGSVFEGFSISGHTGPDLIHATGIVDRFEIKNNRFWANDCGDIIEGGEQATLIIHGNLFFGNHDANIIVTTGPNCEVIKNTIPLGYRGLAVYGENSKILNNIITGIEFYAIFNPHPTTVVDYNDFWNNGDNGNPGTNGFSIDPIFSNPTGYIYKLSQNSPCIDTGDPNPIYNDPDLSRGDLGCFFYDNRTLISNVQPSVNQESVSRNPEISITFSLEMDESTINSNSFLSYGSLTGYHQGNISYDPQTRIAFFTPTEPYAIGETVYNILTTDIESIYVPYLSKPFVWSFNVESGGNGADYTFIDNYPVDEWPVSVTGADLNNDNFIDVIGANLSDNIEILMNDGIGSFLPAVEYYSDVYPSSVTSADFNRDDFIDVASSNEQSNTVSILLNNGDGTLSSPVLYTVTEQPWDIASGDVNVDGFIDIVTANKHEPYGVSVLINNGDGTFKPNIVYTDFSIDEEPASVYLSDLDNDGDLDIITANMGGSAQSITTIFNNGDGVFGNHIDYLTGGVTPMCAIAFDFNADGYNDIAVTNAGTDDITIFLNDGNGSFPSYSQFNVGDSPNKVIGRDIDYDTDIDLIISHEHSNDIYLLLNNGSGGFSFHTSLPGNGILRSVFAADFDGDTDIDIIASNMGQQSLTHYSHDGPYLGPVIFVSVDGSDQTGNGSESNPFASIKRALYFANDNDTIIVKEGEYTGPENSNIDFQGRSIVLKSEIGPESTIIYTGMQEEKVFLFQSGEDQNTIIDGFTISGHENANAYDPQLVEVMSASPVFKNCTFQNGGCGRNFSPVHLSNSNSIFVNSRFVNNSSGYLDSKAIEEKQASYRDGGALGIWDNSDVSIISCEFSNNYTSYTAGGAVVISGSSATFEDCIFANNTTWMLDYRPFGGAIYYENSNVELENCDFISNGPESFWGGAIFCENLSNTSINNCRFVSNNSRDNGGGIYAKNSTFNITNSVFTKNTANNYYNENSFGGAIYSDESIFSIINCAFVANHIVKSDEYPFICEGSAIYNVGNGPYIQNCIIAYNKNGRAVYCAEAGDIPYIECTNIFANEGGDWEGYIEFMFGMYGNISENPLFCDTANADLALFNTSSCLPENNSCNELIGAFGLGCYVGYCDSVEVDITSSNLNVTDHTPLVSWNFVDPGGSPLVFTEIAVGTDDDWTYAEMWNPAPFYSSDTFVVYNGSPLVDGDIYYLRLRVNNGLIWSEWYETSFRMNSVPSLPVPVEPINDTLVLTDLPILVIASANDHEGDILSYEFQYVNDTMHEPMLITITDVADTAVQVSGPLFDNCRYFWSARSFDGYEYSDWSGSGSFWVNSANQAPGNFQALEPPGESQQPVYNMLPAFSWTTAIDDDPLDSVYYDLIIAADANFNFALTIDSIWAEEHIVTDSLEFGEQYWWKVRAVDNYGLSTYSDNIKDFKTWKLGDVNANWTVDILDIVYLVNFKFKGGPAPTPMFSGDMDGNCTINILDIVYLVNYKFKTGPEPLVGCE